MPVLSLPCLNSCIEISFIQAERKKTQISLGKGPFCVYVSSSTLSKQCYRWRALCWSWCRPAVCYRWEMAGFGKSMGRSGANTVMDGPEGRSRWRARDRVPGSSWGGWGGRAVLLVGSQIPAAQVWHWRWATNVPQGLPGALWNYHSTQVFLRNHKLSGF